MISFGEMAIVARHSDKRARKKWQIVETLSYSLVTLTIMKGCLQVSEHTH
jgi:hypothetical protein